MTDDGSINTSPDVETQPPILPPTLALPPKLAAVPNTRQKVQEARAKLSAFWNAHYDLKNPTKELPAHEVDCPDNP